MIFLNSVSSAAAPVFYLPDVCTHTDPEGKQSLEYFKIYGKKTQFNEHPVTSIKYSAHLSVRNDSKLDNRLCRFSGNFLVNIKLKEYINIIKILSALTFYLALIIFFFNFISISVNAESREIIQPVSFPPQLRNRRQICVYFDSKVSV